MNYDFIVIGSGFGGSVASLRLAEKGYSLLILEQGHRTIMSGTGVEGTQPCGQVLVLSPLNFPFQLAFMPVRYPPYPALKTKIVSFLLR